MIVGKALSHLFKNCVFVSDANECNASHLLCDVVNGICQNTIGSYICLCKNGFTGDGKSCDGKMNIFLSVTTGNPKY